METAVAAEPSTKVLLISQGMSFMVNAIEKNLHDAGYEVVRIDPKISEMAKHKGDARLILFFLGSYVSEIPEVLVYLKDVCVEEEKGLILLGNPAELEIAEDQIPSAVVTARFERPFDMQKMVEEANRFVQVEEGLTRRKSILLVDDDGTFLKMVKDWLSYKYRVTIVTSGAQAMMYIADNTPDLILLDYEMPVTSGPQVLEMIRSEPRLDSIPVIFLTGKGDRESVMKVLALKPDGYFLKTKGRDELRAALDEFFEKKRYEDLHEKSMKK